MPEAPRCEAVQFELSLAHDEQVELGNDSVEHLGGCEECAAFRQDLTRLDAVMAAGNVARAPDVLPAVRASLEGRRPRWAWVAVAAIAGVLIGVVAAGVGRLDTVEARELDNRLQAASPSMTGLEAELVIVERGWHPLVPERVYTGSLTYVAPEELAIELRDTTIYPSDQWIPNDVSVAISNGNLVTTAGSPCPVAAVPGCLRAPSTSAISGLKPFDAGLMVPLEMVGPTSTLTLWSGLEVVGTSRLEGREVIQVETTVAGADLIGAIVDRGAWRSLHPADRVLMWLDEATLVPIRLEVFASDSSARELWQLRRGYSDDRDEPIFIVALSRLGFAPEAVEVTVPDDAAFGGFVDGPAQLPPTAELPAGFISHRSGRWILPDGGRVEVASWSDGRAWIMVEATDDWTVPELFGISSALARPLELGNGSIGYVEASGDAVAIHADGLDVLVSGAVSEEVLVSVAGSLGLTGLAAPPDWAQAAAVEPALLPEGTLVPRVEGWSILGAVEGDQVTVLMTGTGSRRVTITSQPGERLAPPSGPDVISVGVRGESGRYQTEAGILEWTEAGRVVAMGSDTLSLDELVELAGTMAPR